MLRTIGVVVAMEQEFSALYPALIPEATITEKNYSRIARGNRAGVHYIILQSGVGTTNGAFGAYQLISEFAPDCVLNLGTAALIQDPAGRLQVGDVLVGEKHYQWDLDMGGAITPAWTKTRSYIDVLECKKLQPHKSLLAAAFQVLKTSPATGLAQFFTGNSFFKSDGQHAFLPLGSETVAVDMESFAVAQVCARKGIPFLCIRGVSDTGRADAESDFYTNLGKACRSAAQITLELVNLSLEEELNC